MANKTLKMISWNVNGLKTRRCDIHYYVNKHNIDVILLQETGDRNGDLLHLKGYTKYQLLAGVGTRGLTTYIRNSIPSSLIEEPRRNAGIESVCVSIHLEEGLLNIVNLYITKNCFCIDSLPDAVFNSATLVAGDLNARHGDFDKSGKVNTNGVRFRQFLADYPDAILLGTQDATHILGGRLDYAVLLNGQGLAGKCAVVPELLSDHFSLEITLPLGKLGLEGLTRKRLWLPKDKIASFTDSIKRWHATYIPTDANKFYEDMVTIIDDLLRNENKGCSPRPRTNRYYNDKTLKEWSLMLRRAHRKWADDGGDDSDRHALTETAKICSDFRREVRGKYWENFAGRVGKCKNVSEIWKEVNKVRGKRVSSVAHPQPDRRANELMDAWAHAASCASLPQDIIEALRGWEGTRRDFILSALNTGDVTDVAISRDELLRAVKVGKATAPGEDGITYDILNCLASIEDGPLLKLFNMSLREGKLPRAWKKAIIIPVPKPNGGQRPVSLTSCCAKMMERVILNRLLYLTDSQLSENLFGFMKGRGTSDAVIRCLSSDNDYCRVFVDLKGAFDKANGEVILFELARLGVKGKVLYWIGDYLFGRRAQVCFQGHLSQEKHLELGTPQGGVLSPTLFNIMMNRIAQDRLCAGVTTIIYADDILLQGSSTENMQEALNKFWSITQSMGLVINEEKTKFQCRAKGRKELAINGQQLERVRTYKYLGIHIGYTADSREAELNHLTVQCKARLQPLRSLAWSGRGAGVPVLRMLYLTTIRTIIDYASPVLTCFDEGRWEKVEKIQNEAMRIVLHCPKNAMIDTMRMEMNLSSLRSRAEETNIIAALRHMRSGAGNKLARDIHLGMREPTTFRKQGKRGYRAKLVDAICKYNLQSHCRGREQLRGLPPWEEECVAVDRLVLEKKKCLYSTAVLKAKTEDKIMSLLDRGTHQQVFCDGAVLEDGRAGCGVLMRLVQEKPVEEQEYSFRVSDNVSSTQAELCAIFLGLRAVENQNGNAHFFIDSRSAVESLTSRRPVCEETVTNCKTVIRKIRKQNRSVTFIWIPSHVGVRHNDRADRLAKSGAEKDTVDLTCTLTLKQLKTNIRRKQDEEAARVMERKHVHSETFKHYIKISQMTDFTYGRSRRMTGDALCTRLRLGYKYLWQLGVQRTEGDVCCGLCKEPRSHTLRHYTLECPSLDMYRNPNIGNVTDQIIWMFQNGVVDKIIQTHKYIENIVRQ